jgi:hypothetical protein
MIRSAPIAGARYNAAKVSSKFQRAAVAAFGRCLMAKAVGTTSVPAMILQASRRDRVGGFRRAQSLVDGAT